MRRGGSAVVVLASMIGLALAQQPERPASPGEPGPAPERVREGLMRALDETTDTQSNIREALRRLEAGEPIGVVLEAMPRVRRFVERTGGPERGEVGFGPMRRRGGGDGAQPPTEAQVAEVRAFVRENLPRLEERLERAEAIAPGSADRLFERIAPRLLEFRRLRDEDPAMAEAKTSEFVSGIGVIEATRSLRRSDEGDRTAAREALAAALREHFDARHAVKAMEIERLSRRLEAMRSDLEASLSRRDAFVEEKIAEIESGAGGPPVGVAPGEGRGPGASGDD